MLVNLSAEALSFQYLPLQVCWVPVTVRRDCIPNKPGVRGRAKEDVHTISPPLIPKTTGSDKKICPHSENSVSPKSVSYSLSLSQSLYRSCSIFPQATSYRATIGPHYKDSAQFLSTREKPSAFSHFLPPIVKDQSSMEEKRNVFSTLTCNIPYQKLHFLLQLHISLERSSKTWWF